jgi:hypothetical protein
MSNVIHIQCAVLISGAPVTSLDAKKRDVRKITAFYISEQFAVMEETNYLNVVWNGQLAEAATVTFMGGVVATLVVWGR